ncbi:MAG: peptidylprolyl isomerase [Vicinamibacterales bacterium]
MRPPAWLTAPHPACRPVAVPGRRGFAAVVAAGLTAVLLPALQGPASAQMVNAARLAVLQAEDRRAPTAADLATLRTASRSVDPQTSRFAVRALGRLERPGLVADIQPALDSTSPLVRIEAANAVAQALSAQRRGAVGGPSVASVAQGLASRLADEDDPDVRAALAESLGRLPYADADASAPAQQALVDALTSNATVPDRLGVAKGFEALTRGVKGIDLSEPARELLRGLVGVVSLEGAEPLGGTLSRQAGSSSDPSRDARVRRLALAALVQAGAADDVVIERALADADPQVRRQAVHAAAGLGDRAVLTRGLEDPAPMVRFEAVRGLTEKPEPDSCAWTVAATADADPHVVLLAIDRLGACATWDQALTRLADFAADKARLGTPRGWHRAAHAIVALAAAAPDRAKTLLPLHAAAPNPFVRVYAARAALSLGDRETLERLAEDPDDNVVEAAIDGLVKVAGERATPRYLAAVARRGYQAVRAGARALESGPADPVVIDVLTRSLESLVAEGHDNSLDARRALVAALEKRGAPVPKQALDVPAPRSSLDLAELRRLAAPRARVSIRNVGLFDLALFTMEAPATVLQFARLVESGYYNGLTIHRVVPTFVLQGGSPGANEYVGHPNYMRDEVGTWPHVRGAAGISTRGRDTGDAQFFLDLVDNPRLDHEYTVFGQVISGLETVDRILEGDVIESIQILDAN